jgi:hypothetical protein
MIYIALCVMLLMRAASITWASGKGLGPGNLDFFGSQMVLAYWLDAISQAQKSPTCPPNGCTRIKSITHDVQPFQTHFHKKLQNLDATFSTILCQLLTAFTIFNNLVSVYGQGLI